MKNLIRELNGYRLLYVPEHPSSMKNRNWEGYIYEHIYFIEQSLGRELRENEVVHHLDGNRSNNRIENLIVLEHSQHMKLHLWLDNGAFIHESYERNGMNSGKSRITNPSYCSNCGICLQLKQEIACSEKCSAFLRRKIKDRPSYEQLLEDIKNTSYSATGRKYGVSDNCVRRWLSEYETILSQAASTLAEGAETTGEVKSS